MFTAAGDACINRLTELFNQIILNEIIPEDWNTSTIFSCFKNKGDATERGNYRGLKLLEHAMKVIERVIELEIRKSVNIDDMQFGFMPGRGTFDTIFIVKQLQEKFLREKERSLFCF